MLVESHAETFALRTALRELVALSTVQAVWVGREAATIAAGLADVLIGSLRLEFAFVRLRDPKGGEEIEFTQGHAWNAFSEWLRTHLDDASQFSRKRIVIDLIGSEPCRGVVFPIGVNGERGLVAAACTRTDFPSEIDNLLLSVAANHAATAFQNAHLRNELDTKVAELRQARNELEIKVAQRTAELRRSEAYLADAQRLTHTGSWAFYPSIPEHSYCSWEFYRIFGFDPATDRPRYSTAWERVHPDDRARFDRTLQEAIRKKADFDTSYRVVLPDGTMKHVHSVAYPVFDQEGEVVEMVGISMDVTEQYRSKAALEKAFEEIRDLKDQLYKENLALRDEVDRASMFEEIIGTSPALQGVLARIAKVAPTDSTVLITGETGTGKELIARAVHKRSQRSARAFVSVNCAALAPSLISSELFGHEKGAFTGATQRRLGRFELADGGTIFLDEVGELPPDTQVALLRVLQEREFERVGGTQSIRVDVRVIAATNRDLEAATAGGTFRLDLFYRLNVFPIEVPPLRERKDDILMLLEYFVKRYAGRAGKNIRSIDKKTLELFQSYGWPGNIRELQNVVERSVIVSSGDVFSVDESWLSKESSQLASRVDESRPVETDGPGEREIIEAVLAETRGRVSGPSGAAARLRIPPSTLEHKIKALHIRKSQFKYG